MLLLKRRQPPPPRPARTSLRTDIATAGTAASTLFEGKKNSTEAHQSGLPSFRKFVGDGRHPEPHLRTRRTCSSIVGHVYEDERRHFMRQSRHTGQQREAHAGNHLHDVGRPGRDRIIGFARMSGLTKEGSLIQRRLHCSPSRGPFHPSNSACCVDSGE
ncbi:hypothetical protein EJ02DRAFT_171024 [Clathrospora elynae]|uniref:Uncharacterized protein n=1 Tax=Clathrospora elynae TaxID=706981 RepID=A0A6A5T4K8_9PLEO|nr:hypothetical protein EJ02DRAFT_171024 [Clathrospora elynae]